MKKRIKNLLLGVFGDRIVDYMHIKYSSLKLKRRHLDVYDNMLNNKRFENTHLGERCFILGNGPSLRNVTLKQLKNEFVFSVNNFSQVKNYRDAKINVHLWMDLSFFNLRDDQKYELNQLLKNYNSIAEQHPICFMPCDAAPFVKENQLDKILDINYLNCFRINSDDNKIYDDISQPINSYSTVVQYAIIIACYMGFKEIYLLGCDTTNIVSLINCAMEMTNENMHAYDNDDVNERYKELLGKWTMTEVFFDQYMLFLGYRRLYEFCTSKQIKLVNCSDNTLINEIPRDSLENILKR